MDFLKVRNMTALDRMLDFPEIGLAVSEEMVVHPLFQSLLREKPKFDLLLQEAFVSEGLMAGLARYFQVPFIGYATFIPSSWTHYMVRTTFLYLRKLNVSTSITSFVLRLLPLFSGWKHRPNVISPRAFYRQSLPDELLPKNGKFPVCCHL